MWTNKPQNGDVAQFGLGVSFYIAGNISYYTPDIFTWFTDISVSCAGCMISVPFVMYIDILLGTPGHSLFLSKINLQNNHAVTNIVRRKIVFVL